MKRNREKAPREDTQSFDHSLSVLSDCHIELRGSGAMIIEGCNGVLAYDETQVRIGLKKQVLLITGERLIIDSMIGQTVRVCGRIVCVEFV